MQRRTEKKHRDQSLQRSVQTQEQQLNTDRQLAAPRDKYNREDHRENMYLCLKDHYVTSAKNKYKEHTKQGTLSTEDD